MFEFKFSREGLLMIGVTVALILYIGVYIARVWTVRVKQKNNMERIYVNTWRSFPEWSYQTVSEIEAAYKRYLPTERKYSPVYVAYPMKWDVDNDEDPTLDMKLQC